MHARLRGTNNLLILHLVINRTWFHLADEIAEPRPYVNIKVTAFTESKKFYYICRSHTGWYDNVLYWALFERLFV